jgi:hypothetical protein
MPVKDPVSGGVHKALHSEAVNRARECQRQVLVNLSEEWDRKPMSAYCHLRVDLK